jgi:high mobility group protein B2
MAKRTQRDPGAPKRNMSAYLLYQNAMREQFKALNPGMTFGQLAKYTSAMYSELAPSEKEAWVARAEADKARYLHELASYAPPPGFDPKGDAIVSPISTKYGRKGKPEKDANAPKRNMSAYLLYQNAMREQFKRENPGMTFGQLAKYTSHMYKNLTPEEKATWEARAQQDKARYDAEIAAYVPPPGHDARGVLIEDSRPRKRNKRGPKDPAAPKRASGAYVFFTNEMRPKVLHEFPGIKFVELGKVLGERWRALTPEEKKRYEEMAGEDKVRFQMEMQQYTSNQAAAAPPPPPVEHSYYQDPHAGYGVDAYATHEVAHHDPYAQHHHHAHYPA